MREKSTDELQRELLEAMDLDQFLSGNRGQFSCESVAGALDRLFRQKNISKTALARRSGMSEIYLHQIFAGRRNPSRNRLICLCCGLGATLDETQKILQQAGYAQIYPRVKRDAIIGHGIAHQTELGAINDRLFAENEKTLF